LTFNDCGIELGVDLEKTGVVIPALNAEKTIGAVLDALLKYGFKKENIIVIDDGSTDQTSAVVAGFGVALLKNEKNLGKGAALKRGFEKARLMRLQGVFTLDADGQHRVEEIRNFLELCNGYDLIIGMRRDVLKMPSLRRLVNRITSLVISVLSQKSIPDVQCGFRYINLRIFERVFLKTNNYQTESEMVFKAIKNDYHIGFIPITTVYNNESSYIHPVIDTIRFIKMAVGLLWH